MRIIIQLAEETRQPPFGKTVQWPGVLVLKIVSGGITEVFPNMLGFEF